MNRLNQKLTGRAAPVLAVLAAGACLVLASCGGGLSQAEVEDIVEESAPEAGLSQAEVEAIVQSAIAEAAEPLSAGQQQDSAASPPKTDPVAYTKHFVSEAINRYEAEGLRATLDHYNDPASLDGPWYVFIVGDGGEVIGHYDSTRLGNDLNGWVGTDANGYNFGSDMLAATEQGRWVTYVYQNPETNSTDPSDYQLKSAWVVRHDGLLFGSGWYPGVDEFITTVVAVAAETFSSRGFEATDKLFADPTSVFGGLNATLAYYDSTNAIDREWLAFAASSDGQIISTYNASGFLGENIQERLGVDIVGQATEDGTWITLPSSDPDASEEDSLRIYAVSQDGMTFGGGWYKPPNP